MYNTTDYCLHGEMWRYVVGYEGTYEVSNFGRVRSVDGKTTTSNRHGERRWNGRIIRPKGINPKTGHRVSLWKDKKSTDHLVCRLVGNAFLGVPEDPKMTINHIDGNRFNNNVDNLEWLSLADNIRHAFKTGLMPTKSVDLEIEGEVKHFISCSEASRYLGKNNGYISNFLAKGKNRKLKDKSGNQVKIIS